MAAPPPPPPALPDELVQEILLRLPPDNPACLLRAFLVCKAWGCAVSLPSFRRRLHELHRAQPLLGFLPNWGNDDTPCFIPTTASSFSLDAPDCLSWRALDCRHGRALFLSIDQDPEELLVWEPITGAQKRVPLPEECDRLVAAAAVFCAADGCDHRDCLGAPFRVVFVFSFQEDDEDDEEFAYGTSACLYSSETGAWGELPSLHGEPIKVAENSGVLVGSSLLYFAADVSILEYDLARHTLTVLSPPDSYCDRYYLNLMTTEGGGLGVIEVLDSHLKLWTREVSDTDARWVLSRVICLDNLLPTDARLDEGGRGYVRVLGFAEGANAIFFETDTSVFIIELQSEQVRKACDDCVYGNLVPLVTFYTPHVPRGDHQNLLVLKPSEEAGGEEGDETIDQAQQLFDKGSNAIKEACFVNTFQCVSHAYDIREVALACASTFDKYGCAYKAQEVNDSLDDVPNSAANEESVKGTASEDDVPDSKNSVEGAAPSSEKGDSEEVLH